MTKLTQLLAGMILALSLLSTAHANSIGISIDQFAVHQSDTPATEEAGDDEGKKKKDGEEEEPDC